MIVAREYWLILVDVPNHPTNLEEEMEWIQVDRSDVESIIELDQDTLDIGETQMKRLDTREDVPFRMIPIDKEDRDERDVVVEGERLVHLPHTPSITYYHSCSPVSGNTGYSTIQFPCLIHTSYLTSTFVSIRR